MSVFRCLTAIVLLTVPSFDVFATDDWPQWRFDAGHTAASPNVLPAKLSLQWTRRYSQREQVWDDPLNHDLMPYDRIFEPIISDGRMFIGFNDTDKVVALNLDDGTELWSYFTDGPVRFPPVAWKDRVICVSDDGYLHCVNADDGSLIWKRRGGPSDRKVLGNERVISAWPARGGPVVVDDTVYFAASIWPFMGTFIYAIDPVDGDVLWVNDATSADYIKQPHSAPSFAGVAPQGTLGVAGDSLIVPGGRSVPAVLDRKTGQQKYFEINAGGKGTGGSLVIAHRDEFYVHTRLRGVRAHNLEDGKKTAFVVNEPVLTDELIYTFLMRGDTPVVQAFDADDVDRKTQKKLVWEVEADGRGDLILAGDPLYAAGEGSITPINLADDPRQTPHVDSSFKVEGEVLRLVAANQCLAAVTLDGQIHVFGEGGESDSPVIDANTEPPAKQPADADFAQSLLQDVDSSGGYVLWFGAHNAAQISGVLKASKVQLVVVNEDQESVDRLRRHFDAAGLYGSRITVHAGTPQSYRAPQYIANAVIVGERFATPLVSDASELNAAFDSVRPYGGSLIVLNDGPVPEAVGNALKQAELENATVNVADNQAIVKRVGALKGSADWTHQYGDVANTVKSDDSRVKAPLGLLWFGGSSNEDVLPRHGHGPPEQVVDGRLYVEGHNSLSCRDVYTGRVIWHRVFENLGTSDIYFDDTYKDTPLDTAYNQVHIPGANGRGTNYVVTSEALYLAIGSACLLLDPSTGETVKTISLPKSDGQQPLWGYIGVYKDVLLAGNGFANFRTRHGLDFSESDGKLRRNSTGFGSKSFDTSASAGLIAFDRHSGKQLWQLDARHSVLHNGIAAGDGTVFCLDRLPKPIEDKLARRGKATPETYRIVAVDVLTGRKKWENNDRIFGSWLSYSDEHKLLLQAGASASDRLKSEVGAGMAVLNGEDGTIKWRVDDRKYSGPCMLHGTTILTNANSYQLSAGAFNLLDGSPVLATNPLTGEQQPWQVCRAYGCNNIIASENLLTFRSGAAGYYDLTTRGGTGNLGGFKSGCTANLVVANGVLNAPDYTRTCSCGYQNQTSVGLVHMPEMEMWTVNHEARLTKPGARVERIGVNFGAPGDRIDASGTLWMEWPPVGGEHADVKIQVEGKPDWYRTSSLTLEGDSPSWIGASGVMNASRVTIPMKIHEDDAGGLTFNIVKHSDDAEEADDCGYSLGSIDLDLLKDGSNQHIGLRFDKVSVPRGTKIRSAVIQFTTDEKTSDATELIVQAFDSADPATFVEKPHDVTSRKLLSQQVKWAPKPWRKEDEAGELQRTPDLKDLVQQLINRPDWKPGNAIGFVISGHGKRVAQSSRKGTGGPRLIIDADTLDARTPSKPESHPHTVRLHFAAPDVIAASAASFSVSLQGNKVIDDLNIASATSDKKQTLVREFKNVAIAGELTIDLTATQGQTVLCGVAIVREKN